MLSVLYARREHWRLAALQAVSRKGRESFNLHRAFLLAALVIEQSLILYLRARKGRPARARASETVLLHATGV